MDCVKIDNDDKQSYTPQPADVNYYIAMVLSEKNISATKQELEELLAGDDTKLQFPDSPKFIFASTGAEVAKITVSAAELAKYTNLVYINSDLTEDNVGYGTS